MFKGREKTTPSGKSLSCLPSPLQMAKEMGQGMGRSQIL